MPADSPSALTSSDSSISNSSIWHEANRSYLMGCFSRLRNQLEQQANKSHAMTPATDAGSASWLPSPSKQGGQTGSFAIVKLIVFSHLACWLTHAALGQGVALNQLVKRFGLTPFETNVLLLCAGVELEATWGPLCAAAQGDAQLGYPTFALALTLFPSAHWSALTPHAPLRRWQLIHVQRDQPLARSPLRIDERILHHLLGLTYLDESLAKLVQRVSSPLSLVTSHKAIVKKLTTTWQNLKELSDYPVIQLCGSDHAGKQAIAAAACQQLGLTLYSLPTVLLPSQSQDLQAFLQRWEREALLTRSALLIDDDSPMPDNTGRDSAIAHALETARGPVIISNRDRRPARHRPFVTFDITQPTSQEQRLLWQESLGHTAPSLNGCIDALVSQFDLSAPAVRTIGNTVLKQVTSDLVAEKKLAKKNNQPPEKSLQNNIKQHLKQQLWDSCRAQARPRLSDLAQPITARASWDDLVLPSEQKAVLREIAAHVRQRAKVYEYWGFGGGGRGLGISALFAGASGTGKTMAAEVLAGELQLDLYRIDLSAVVSKYIGETEKNLRRVFDAAEMGGAILLFDEADSLFGKRSEVKDSHDRHANIEVSYLLQRMEAYQGLAILTTNLKDALDQAFLRRIRFTVRFTFPDATQREEMWRRAFPPNVPTDSLKPNKLARLNVAGGNIRNIALNAAFLAADANESVQMKHILEASLSEYIKLEKTPVEAETRGWV